MIGIDCTGMQRLWLPFLSCQPIKAKWMCPITSRQLASSDVTDTAVRIGEQTVLFLPTSEGGSNLQRVSTSISFDVIERTQLASMNEGIHNR